MIRRSLAERLIAAAAAIALVAAAIGLAVHIIVSVWAPLVVIGAVSAVLVISGWAIRSRSQGW